jgi:hypothetical protein
MKKMSMENEREFDELASYVGFYATNVWNVPYDVPTHPSRFLIQGKFTKSQLLVGLRQAANDTVDDSARYSPEQVAKFDRQCVTANVLTLSEVRRRYSRQYKAILKKQRITTETDYYLVVGILCDTTNSVNAEERRVLEWLVMAYEKNVGLDETEKQAGDDTNV